MKRNIKTYSEFINEKIKHVTDTDWQVFSKAGELKGTFTTRQEAREFESTLKKQNRI
jgi:hypothetical protein